MKIQLCEKQDQQSKFYFRPFVKTTKEIIEPKEEKPNEEFIDDDQALLHEEFEQSLLWVHQTDWQREMLLKYGNTMTLMDATYKVTKYDIPFPNCSY